jgi:hypothetical protein
MAGVVLCCVRTFQMILMLTLRSEVFNSDVNASVDERFLLVSLCDETSKS